MDVTTFISRNYLHFNAKSLHKAARAYSDLINRGGKMVVCLGGAMSTAELGVSLAEMIRADKIHGVCCTGANLEEDFFGLLGRSEYPVLDWRNLSVQHEMELLGANMNRVTDTAIPEKTMIKVEEALLKEWELAERCGERLLPHEFFFRILQNEYLCSEYEHSENSWLLATLENDIPVWVPGWEDSSMGNIFAARLLDGKVTNPDIVLGGVEYMVDLAEWYQANSGNGVGYFQIGGGIAGDFAICVVPMLRQDLCKDVPHWAYFCQISDSITSYGSYSGAVPNEKITWDKIGKETPRFVVESDATIVAPLIFSYVLGQ